MMNRYTAAAIIPARYGSTRLPGKPILRDPSGKYLIQYVCEAASRAGRMERVIVATDDRRIFDVVKSLGFEAAMTSDQHHSGSDRAAEVARALKVDVVVNIQGDEPQILPEQIDQTVELLERAGDCVVSTLASRIESDEELNDRNVVKVVVDDEWRALYFSRLPIPFVRDAQQQLVTQATASPSMPRCEPGGPLTQGSRSEHKEGLRPPWRLRRLLCLAANLGGRAPTGSAASIKRDCVPPHLHHIGIYGYRRDFLLRFVELPPAALELAEKLEQLRVLSVGERIKVGLTSHKMKGIDTPADYEAFCRQVAAAPGAAEQEKGERSK